MCSFELRLKITFLRFLILLIILIEILSIPFVHSFEHRRERTYRNVNEDESADETTKTNNYLSLINHLNYKYYQKHDVNNNADDDNYVEVLTAVNNNNNLANLINQNNETRLNKNSLPDIDSHSKVLLISETVLLSDDKKHQSNFQTSINKNNDKNKNKNNNNKKTNNNYNLDFKNFISKKNGELVKKDYNIRSVIYNNHIHHYRNRHRIDNIRNLWSDLLNEKFNKIDKKRTIRSTELNSKVAREGVINNQIVDEREPCILRSAEFYLSWWINKDGTLKKNTEEKEASNFALDLSFPSRTAGTVFDRIKQHFQNSVYTTHIVRFLSAAHNNLMDIPYQALTLVNDTLEYLSLTGNDFSRSNNPDLSTFPQLPQLLELDIRNCTVYSINECAFKKMPKLRKLFLSENRIFKLEYETFNHLKFLTHLDLSYNDATMPIVAMDGNDLIRDVETTTVYDPYVRLTEGLELVDLLFSGMNELEFLDLSHSKLSPASARTFSSLSNNLKELSLCYTNLPIIPSGMFNGTKLHTLDISGNPALAFQLQIDSFKGLENTLEVLSAQNSNIKPLDWLTDLSVLKILKLKNNNINQLTNETFKYLKSIELIDMDSNHIGNWYYRIFEYNYSLKILKLSDNNINFMTTEMLKDFAELDYLAIGGNNFICNCLLREFIDLAAINNREPLCMASSLLTLSTESTNAIKTSTDLFAMPQSISQNHTYDIKIQLYHEYLSTLPESYKNVAKLKEKNYIYKLKNYKRPKNGTEFSENNLRIGNFDYTSKNYDQLKYVPPPCNDNNLTCSKLLEARQTLNFTFQLLDFNENSYHCINSTTNNKYLLTELENCFGDRLWDLTGLRNTTNTLSIVLIVLFVSFIIFIIIYYKWWYVRYFLIIVKNATILSFLDKNKKNIQDSTNSNDEYAYDVFVSYCDGNREWILEELLPNIEQQRDIKICLHERDFQVGLSILENIISCMDRSRCLLLVVSDSFLLSQWCQFEMHLAQHRLLETRREQLILILLEDIPKRKRPKTLHYLMRTKTYIKWPVEDKRKLTNYRPISKHLADERILFWKRLRRALLSNNWDMDVTHV